MASDNKQKKKQKAGDPANQITDWLWIGCGQDAHREDLLVNESITHILNCAREWKPPVEMQLPPGERQRYAGVEYLHLQLDDVEDAALSEHLPQAFDFLERCTRGRCRLLVHCVMGKSRSVSVVLAWLMHSQRMRLCDAFDLVRSKRAIQPNDGFMRQLVELEKHYLGVDTSSIDGRYEWGLSKQPKSKPAKQPRPPRPVALLSDHELDAARQWTAHQLAGAASTSFCLDSETTALRDASKYLVPLYQANKADLSFSIAALRSVFPPLIRQLYSLTSSPKQSFSESFESTFEPSESSTFEPSESSESSTSETRTSS